MIRQLVIAFVAALLLSGCMAVKLNIDTLNPDDPVKNGLPLNANVRIYVAFPYIQNDGEDNSNTKNELSDLDKEKHVKRLLLFKAIKESSKKIAEKYFTGVEKLNGKDRPSYLVLLKGDLDTSRIDFIRMGTANIEIKIYDVEGDLVFSRSVLETESTLHRLNEAIFFNAASKAQMELYDAFVKNYNSLPKKDYSKNVFSKAIFNKIFSNINTKVVATASGFLVNEEGYLVTNNHVVDQCIKIEVNKEKGNYFADVLAIDKEQDLALLKTDLRGTQYAKFSDLGKGARLGDDAIVIGYPLQGLLTSKPSLTKGNISALAGINNNETYYQFTAPIQSGNSGGPLLNQNGSIIGVVTSKLNAVKLARYTGEIPQNINFAIKGEKVAEFLKGNNVIYHYSKNNDKLSAPDIAETAVSYTHKVSCYAYAIDLNEFVPAPDEN